MLEAIKVQLQPKNLKVLVKSVSDIFWQFSVPPAIIVSVEGKKVQVRVNRKEDLEQAVQQLKSLLEKQLKSDGHFKLKLYTHIY
ncbi:hypothetical protein [Candidatus Albibeggiatoa sp. nov. BB20]|uniref:hypothetical protein n=1 Tax=Candidatus Albibeggiatoa sp. nov. BB20 TaxID=3162723 RepID=UPI003365A63B